MASETRRGELTILLKKVCTQEEILFQSLPGTPLLFVQSYEK